MKIYYSVDDFNPVKNAVVTSGTFDGVHVGHQKILNRLKEIAGNIGGETVVITFWPHPRYVLKPGATPHLLLNTFEEKADLIKEQGIDHLLRIPFTKEFSQTTSTEFIESILVKKIGTKKLVIGYDHKFGKDREGSFEQLSLNAKNYGFEVEEIPRQDIDNDAVSSSRIRKALEEGDVETASHFLGRPYSLSGRVVKGDKLGRVLGYPTANIDIDSNDKLVPDHGIYAVTIEHGTEKLKGMLYIGNRPTVDGTRLAIEANIFDFDKDIYGETLKVNLVARIREDAKFNDLETLKEQMHTDKLDTIRVFAERNL
jgi:riboflavin kinase/FMN adenylyltransferase